LYGNARPENFPNVSDYRNLVIAEAMRVMGFVNRFNWGIKNAQLNLEKNKNEPAEFDFDTVGVFRVIIKEKLIEKINASFSNPWDGETIDEESGCVNSKNSTVNCENGRVNENSGCVNSENGRVNEKNGSVNDDSGHVNNRVSIDSLSELEKIIFLLIRSYESVNTKKISELAQIPYRTATRHLKSLRDKGLIEFVGSAKTGGYRITLIMT
jgi:ATP-dependent DNA helicase RecG